jgi:hypothetical protein
MPECFQRELTSCSPVRLQPRPTMSGRGAFNGFAERLVENGFTVTPTRGKVPIIPGMWRIRHPDGRMSDLANLTRAKDAPLRFFAPRAFLCAFLAPAPR